MAPAEVADELSRRATGKKGEKENENQGRH